MGTRWLSSLSMGISIHDRDVLRHLGEQLALISQLPIQAEKIALWKASNGLKPVRPMVMIDQMPWHELDVNGELKLQCEDGFCREMETQLRRTLYRWNHMPADFVFERRVVVPKVIHNTGYGIQVTQDIAVLDPKNDVVGHIFKDNVRTEADIDKIRVPEVSLDVSATAQREQIARSIFDGILDVQMQGMEFWISAWDIIACWRGPEAMLWDLTDRPDFMHKLVGRLMECATAMLDDIEAKGLLACNQSWIHCTGAFTDELPKAGFDPARPRARDVWTMTMAQIFSSVSPQMHEEFEINYIIPWCGRFGMVYYGCCEPLDDRLHIIRKLPNVRKVSMSPWVNLQRGAAAIGPDYVFSRKPSPATLATDRFHPEIVQDDIAATIAACKQHGCPLELILKDISTVRYDPQRLWQWEKIAMRMVQER